MASPQDMERLAALKAQLAQEIDEIDGLNGIGIGRGLSPGTLALHVLVVDDRAAAQIPQRFMGVDVVVDVTGRVSAF